MATTKKEYVVQHGFAHDGVWYGPDNQHEIANFASEFVDELEQKGVILVRDVIVPDNPAPPSAPRFSQSVEG